MMIDGHLDLAMNALRYERDLRLPVDVLREREQGVEDRRGVATMSLHELRQAGVCVAISTVLSRCKPWVKPQRRPGRDDIDYIDPVMTAAAAMAEVAWYELMAREGALRLLSTRADLKAHVAGWVEGDPPGIVLMLEGADPVVDPEHLAYWHDRGVRLLSLGHFGHARYACGTPSPDPASFEKDGPLRPGARALLGNMAELGIVLDLTHTADTSLSEALAIYDGPVCATHCNCRSLADSPRQLSDDHLRSIIRRQGVVGVVTYWRMIRDRASAKLVTLDDLADHVEHICDLAGSDRCVGIGSDLDGGYGSEATPTGLERYRDLLQLGPILSSRGFSDASIRRFFAGNWLDFLGRSLPAG